MFRYTAVSVMEMDFERVDINQCPKGQGNDGPNRFADTARCKETTEVSSSHLERENLRKNQYLVTV